MRAACRIRYARCLSLCPWRHRFVFQTFCTLCALSPCMSLVTACMSCVFCTAAEDDPDAWDASDVDMFTQFSEVKGEGEGGEGWGDGLGWSDPDEARGRQTSQPLFFSHTATAHPHRTSSGVAADATVVAALALPDILFVIV